MNKLSQLREKLIQETKHLIDEDDIAIHQIEQGNTDTNKSIEKGRIITQASDFSTTKNTSTNPIIDMIQPNNKLTKPNLHNHMTASQIKLKNGEDNLHNLQKITLRKNKVGNLQVREEKQQSQQQLNLHNTLLDIQQEYLNFKMKAAQNEYAIDLDMIQEDFEHQQSKFQPSLEFNSSKKKKKSHFINLLKKCKICQQSDLNYASKPFKLMKKLKDIRIMFERKSNNMEQQMKKNNMNKNQIIEDIKADRVVIRKTLPEMAKNYLSEISQKKKINQLIQQKTEFRASKQANQSTPFNQSVSTVFQPNYSKLRLPLSKIASQEQITNNDQTTRVAGDAFILPDSSSNVSFKGNATAATSRIDYRYQSTSPFRKNISFLQDSKTTRHAPISDISSFQEAHNKTTTQKNIPVHNIDYCFSQDNSPYIRPFDEKHKQTNQKINSFNCQSKFFEPSTITSNQNLSTAKPSTHSFSTFHLYSTNELNNTNNLNKNQQIDQNIINSLQNLPTDQVKPNINGHRHSRSDMTSKNTLLGNNLNQNNMNSTTKNQMSIEKIQYLFYLKNQASLKQKEIEVQDLQNSNTLERQNTTFNRKSFNNIAQNNFSNIDDFNSSRLNNKNESNNNLNTFSLLNTPVFKQSQSQLFMTQSKNDQQLPSQYTERQRLSSQTNNTNTFGNFTERMSIKPTQQDKIRTLNKIPQIKNKKAKEGILENVYKFEEDNYFKHQSIYKYEQEKAKIIMIKRNQTHKQNNNNNNNGDSAKNKKEKERKRNESYFHDEFSSNDDSIPSATEAQLDNCYEESTYTQKRRDINKNQQSIKN